MRPSRVPPPCAPSQATFVGIWSQATGALAVQMGPALRSKPQELQDRPIISSSRGGGHIHNNYGAVVTARTLPPMLGREVASSPWTGLGDS